VILPVPMDLFRPYLGEANGSGGDGHARQQTPQTAQRREEEEAERLYEEAVGERPVGEESL